MSHVGMGHVTHIHESCHTYEWFMSHIFMRPVTYINASEHTYEWVMSLICVTWLKHMCDMTHSCVWHDPFLCVTWLIHMCPIESCRSYVWRDHSLSCICTNSTVYGMSGIIHTCQMYITWFICAKSHESHVNLWHIWINDSYVTPHMTHMCHVTHTCDAYVSHDS